MTYHGTERRRTNRGVVAAIGALVLALIVLSTWGLFVAQHATTIANRSEDGFCIAVRLIEDGAVSDAKIANSAGVSADVKQIRTQQYRASLAFALRLRHLGFRCGPPSPEVSQLVRKGKK